MSDSLDVKLNLTTCDREPIHIPGSIQPHGALIALDDSQYLRVVQVSANLANFIGSSPAELLGRPVTDAFACFGPQATSAIESLQSTTVVQELPVLIGTLRASGSSPIDVVAHRHPDGRLIVEFEKHILSAGEDAEAFYRALNRVLLALRAAPDRTALFARTAEEVRRLTRFDRVMVYRFHADDHGEVVAESRRDDVEAFVGLHYPATDIPRQARELYLRSQIRLIADVSYEPAPLLAANHVPPLDLTHAALRSVSPTHIQYLKNMGVGASMSISIVCEDRLWGLIACHNESPGFLSYVERNACELIGQTVAAQITARDAREEREARRRNQTIIDEVARLLEEPSDIAGRLTGSGLATRPADDGRLADDGRPADDGRLADDGRPADEGHTTDDSRALLLDLFECTGAVVVIPAAKAGDTSVVARVGHTPADGFIEDLIVYLNRQPEEILATNQLSDDYPPAASIADVASGLLSIALTRGEPARGAAYLLMFLPEVLTTVRWAGDPAKPAAETAAPALLTPRTSFALWKQEVRRQSRPWTHNDIEAAVALRRVVIGALLRRTQSALAALNEDLVRSNDELDAFAFVASHDLREPLRGIRNYSKFLNEDYRGQIDAGGADMLDTIGKLTTRMEGFLDSLLHYSRVGSTELQRQRTNMNTLVAEVLEVLSFQLAAHGVDVRIPRSLPPARVDAVRAAEVFTNLITNAIKYNTSDEKWIEIGFVDRVGPEASNQTTAYYVRDNGIGIESRNHGAIFLLFRRLHERDKFGGGTGAGLTIVRRIIERHGGTVWVESTPGAGTTFFFTFETVAPLVHGTTSDGAQ